MVNRIAKFYPEDDEIINFVKWPGEEEQKSFDDDNDDFDEGSISLINNVFMSPMGPIKLGKLPNINDIFKFWVGHTNVNLTESILKKIANVDGVEILTPITRYRMKIGIGDMFSDDDVLENIRQILKGLKTDKT